MSYQRLKFDVYILKNCQQIMIVNLLNKLAMFHQFQTWKDLMKVLDYPPNCIESIQQYVSEVYGSIHNLSLYDRRAQAISINQIRDDLNID